MKYSKLLIIISFFAVHISSYGAGRRMRRIPGQAKAFEALSPSTKAMWAAIKAGSIKQLRKIIAHHSNNIDMNALNEDGESPLRYVVKWVTGDAGPEMLRWLLAFGSTESFYQLLGELKLEVDDKKRYALDAEYKTKIEKYDLQRIEEKYRILQGFLNERLQDVPELAAFPPGLLPLVGEYAAYRSMDPAETKFYEELSASTKAMWAAIKAGDNEQLKKIIDDHRNDIDMNALNEKGESPFNYVFNNDNIPSAILRTLLYNGSTKELYDNYRFFQKVVNLVLREGSRSREGSREDQNYFEKIKIIEEFLIQDAMRQVPALAAFPPSLLPLTTEYARED